MAADLGNRLLKRLTRTEYQALQPHLDLVDVHFKETLEEQGRKVEWVYFPTKGVMSMVIELEHGTVETGTIGPEGVVGVSAFLGFAGAAGRTFCQVPGQAMRMSVKHLREHLNNGGQLGSIVLRYVNVQIATLAQTAACNRVHTIEERMARWLLMTADRVAGLEFPLTQEFLSQMLGVRRPSVSLAGAMLQKAGLITYSRGTITILDREKLEDSACECYALIRDRFENGM